MAAGFFDLLARLIPWWSEMPKATAPFRMVAGQVFSTGQVAGHAFSTGQVTGEAFSTGTVAGMVESLG